MIRSSRVEPSLFYSHEELSKSSRKTFYDRLDALNLDWVSLAAPVAKAFCPLANGRPTDPVIYYKAFLVGYLENIECDVDLADRLSDSLSIRRFLFGSLLGTPPDHSSLSRVRRQVGERGDLEGILSASVELLSRAGLVGSESAFIDTSLVPSRAKRTGENVYDAQAEVATKPGYPARPSYKISASVDGTHRVVVGCDAVSAGLGDGGAARASVAETVRNLGGACPARVVADKGMDSSAFHALTEFFGASPVTPLQKNGKEASGFGKERFLYDAERDVYLCPAGEVLNRVSGELAERVTYRASEAVCAECPLRPYCHGDTKTPKSVSRSFDEASRDRVKGSRKDPAIRKLSAMRQAIVEPIFSDFKQRGGLAKIWTKGLCVARVKAKMSAVGWNLKVLVKAIEQGIAALPTTPPPTRQAENDLPNLLREALNLVRRRFLRLRTRFATA